MAKKRKRNVITADKADMDTLEAAIESQGNAIPGAVAVVLRLVAPVLARLVVRFIARKARVKLSETAVNTAGRFAGSLIQRIIDRAAK